MTFSLDSGGDAPIAVAQEVGETGAHEPHPGEYLSEGLLDLVQMDHTKGDVILVDSLRREELGRPWITFLIEISEDLQTWEPNLADEVLLSTTNGVQTWRAIDPQLTTDARHRFLRVKAICP